MPYMPHRLERPMVRTTHCIDYHLLNQLTTLALSQVMLWLTTQQPWDAWQERLTTFSAGPGSLINTP